MWKKPKQQQQTPKHTMVNGKEYQLGNKWNVSLKFLRRTGKHAENLKHMISIKDTG